MTNEVTVGSRVEIHPCYDLWMQGARFGVVRSIKDGVASVKMDHEQVRTQQKIPVSDLKRI